jgi:hypothetical protein
LSNEIIVLKKAEFQSFIPSKFDLLDSGNQTNFKNVCENYGLKEDTIPDINYWRIWNHIPVEWMSGPLEQSNIARMTHPGMLEVSFNKGVSSEDFRSVVITGKNLIDRIQRDGTSERIWFFMPNSQVKMDTPFISVHPTTEVEDNLRTYYKVEMTFNKSNWTRWSQLISEGVKNDEIEDLNYQKK